MKPEHEAAAARSSINDNSHGHNRNKKLIMRDMTKDEIHHVEQRVRRELKALGLLAGNNFGIATAEDDGDAHDEVALELRRLQQELRRVSLLNRERVAVIESLSFDRMAYQEYQMVVLDELNKHIEAAYQRRYKQQHQRKKRANKPGTSSGTGALFPTEAAPIPDAVQLLLEKRRQLIEELSPLFPPYEDRLLPPVHSIFSANEQSYLHSHESDPSFLDSIVIIPRQESIQAYQRYLQRQQDAAAATRINHSRASSASSVAITHHNGTNEAHWQ